MIWFTMLVFAAVPLVVVGFAVRYILFVQHLRKVGVAVPGQVIEQREWRNRGQLYFIPTVQFTTQTGKVIVAENTKKRSPISFLAGQEVVVYYDPQQPTILLFAEQLTSRAMYGSLASAFSLLLLIWWGIGKSFIRLTATNSH